MQNTFTIFNIDNELDNRKVIEVNLYWNSRSFMTISTLTMFGNTNSNRLLFDLLTSILFDELLFDLNLGNKPDDTVSEMTSLLFSLL